jgi:hypothetical protein
MTKQIELPQVEWLAPKGTIETTKSISYLGKVINLKDPQVRLKHPLSIRVSENWLHCSINIVDYPDGHYEVGTPSLRNSLLLLKVSLAYDYLMSYGCLDHGSNEWLESTFETSEENKLLYRIGTV